MKEKEADKVAEKPMNPNSMKLPQELAKPNTRIPTEKP
jgi:hypothetical protein